MAISSSGGYIGLARRYRPQVFSELVGQDQIAHSLSQQVLQNRVAQAYIFSGPRGIGKTSTARILAKSLNCLEGPTPTPCGKCAQCVAIASGNSMDVIEIDGASNNSVENVRDLQETVNQNPFSARRKIYIIDEVHMLSRGAFNALLKTLEEPPSFVIFVFATTEPEKIPETIKSRCQPLQFRRISIEDIVRRLAYVAEREKIEIDPGEQRATLETIASAVDGGLRDALMTLDQMAALSEGTIRLDETVRFLGMVEHDLLIRTVEMLHQRDTQGLLEMVNNLVERGRDLERFVKNLLGFLRDLMILKSGGDESLVHLTGEKLERAKALLWTQSETGQAIDALSYPALLNAINVFMGLQAQIKETVQVRIHLEFAFVKMTAVEPVVDIVHLIRNLDDMAAGRSEPGVGASPLGGPEMARVPRSQTQPMGPAPPAAPPPPEPATPDLFGGGMQRAAAGADRAVARDAVEATQRRRVIANPQALWEAVLAHRERLGMQLSLALKDCRLAAVRNDCADGAGELEIEISKRSLSRGAIENPEKRRRLEALVGELAGKPMRLLVRAVDYSSPLSGDPAVVAGRVRDPASPSYSGTAVAEPSSPS
ncbi:MAG TPA: DNA polymerase III subunit gamma/tau, partial [Sumerlaeia bacterium]|nr:DNA polymerase III subunit gamma/tau [Sumerlaeia bacterium]